MQYRLQRRPTAYCILVDIELLLDVRLGVLELLYPTITTNLLKNNLYARHNDNYGALSNKINQQQYEKAYATRDKTALQATGPTGFLLWLVGETERVLIQNANAHIYDQFFIDVNFGGRYNDLTREERKEILDVLGDMIPADFGIEELNITVKSLTPSFLNSNYNQCMMYSYIEWWEYHYPVMASNEQLLQKKIPDCDIFAPGLFKNNVLLKDTLVELVEGGEKVSVLDVHVRGVSPFFTLHYFHPSLTSIIDPRELQHLST